MIDNQLAIARAFIGYVDSQISGSIALAQHRIDQSMVQQPNYPANPLVDCPALLLRTYKGDLKGRPNAGVSWAYSFSYWYYRKQTVGENHQELLLADLTLIESFFLGNYNPEPIKAAGCDFVMPLQVVVHDELNHPYGEPRMRVSVGEILFGIQAIIN